MIHRVDSADDPRLEPYRHVADPEWLRRKDLFVAEGRLIVSRVMALARYDIRSILVNPPAYQALLGPLSSVAADVYVCDGFILTGITGFNFHRGCLALVARPALEHADRLLSCSRLLALDGVGNPDNVGGLFRTAAAFSVGGMLLSDTTADPLYRKAIRTSMGAALRVPFARLDDWLAGIERFQRRGFRILALTPQPGAVPIAEFAQRVEADERWILLLGSEGAGLQLASLACADVQVRIPIDTAIDSLNVVVAAGIALDRLRNPAAAG